MSIICLTKQMNSNYPFDGLMCVDLGYSYLSSMNDSKQALFLLLKLLKCIFI